MKNKLTRAEKKRIKRRNKSNNSSCKVAGLSVAIGKPETQDQAGYEALEYKHIGGLISLTQPF